MSARTGSAWVTIGRTGAAALFIILAAVLAVRFAGHRPGTAAKKLEIGDQKIDRKEGISHREYKNGRLQEDVTAGRLYLGADGLNHLEGAVEIRDYAGDAGEETDIRADEIVYDPGLTHFQMSGKVSLRTKDLRFEAPSMAYDKDRRQFDTEAGGTFATDRLSGTARNVFYSDEAAVLRLSGGFRVEAASASRPGTAVVISGESFLYDRGRRTGRASGGVRVSREGVDAQAGALDFEVSADERSFLKMVFSDSVACVFGAPERRTSGSQKLEAGEVSVISPPGSSGISKVSARDNCQFVSATRESSNFACKGNRIDMSLGSGAELSKLDASGRARADIGVDKEAGRSLEADAISYDSHLRLVKAAAAKGGTVTLSSTRARIEASSVSLDLAHDGLEAEGSVTCAIEDRPEAPSIGFFAKGKPVFVTCERLASAGTPARSHYCGKVRAWQDRRVVEAGELDFSEDSGDTQGRGGVSAVMPFAPDGTSGERRVEAGGETMIFSSKAATVLFEGKAFARSGKVDLAAGSVLLLLAEGNSRLAQLSARRDVAVKQGRYEGLGADAAYDPAAETVVLTGKPRLEEKGKGASRGDKLTFYLSDGRILIENSGQGRSVTIVDR